MPRPYPVLAYADRLQGVTLCPMCAGVQFGAALSQPELDPTDRIGEIYRHDLDTADTCPCDNCGTVLAPENVSPEGE